MEGKGASHVIGWSYDGVQHVEGYDGIFLGSHRNRRCICNVQHTAPQLELEVKKINRVGSKSVVYGLPGTSVIKMCQIAHKQALSRRMGQVRYLN